MGGANFIIRGAKKISRVPICIKIGSITHFIEFGYVASRYILFYYLHLVRFVIKYTKPYMFGDWAIRLYARTLNPGTTAHESDRF